MMNNSNTSKKPVVMHLLTTLDMGGAERLALSIIDKNQDCMHGIVAGMFSTDGDLARCATSMGIENIGIDAQGTKFQIIMTLYKVLKKHNVSLLHVQAGYLLLYAFFAAKMAGVKIVYTEHALSSIKKYKNIRLGIRIFSKLIGGISCVNEEIKEYFIKELKVSKSKIRIIENGVDTNVFSPIGDKAALPWKNSSEEEFFVFGTVARFAEAKDHPNLINAFAILANKYPQVRLLMVGDGEKREETEKLINALKLNDKIHITGKALDIPERLRSMNIFVISSMREGLPVAILEAMSCALPVISTNVGGIASLNSSEERLQLVPAKDYLSLSNKMEELLLDETKRQNLSKKAHSFILAEKSDRVMANQYLELYKKGGLICPL